NAAHQGAKDGAQQTHLEISSLGSCAPFESIIDKPRVHHNLCCMPNVSIKRTATLVAGILSITISGIAADKLEPGLIGEYFQMEAGLENFPTIEPGRKPSLSRMDKDINFASTTEEFASTKLLDNFYVRWTGVL